MNFIKLIMIKFAQWVDSVYYGYHQATQLNHYADYAGIGFELGYIPAEAMSEFDTLFPGRLKLRNSNCSGMV